MTKSGTDKTKMFSTTLFVLSAIAAATLLLTPVASAAAPAICFNCTRTSSTQCKDFNTCAAGQKCYKEVVKMETGEAGYSWGCASSQLCQLEQHLTETRKRLNEQKCFKCCDDNFCNFGPCTKDYCSTVTCQHNASCTNTPVGHVCACLTGYTGSLCEIDIDECASSPCLNSGTCVDHVGNYTCYCKNGFVGDNCETNVDDCASNPCRNGATCVDGVANYTCLCKPGYTGDNCEVDIDECSSNPCSYGGTCTDLVNGFRCDCIPGITGTLCDINIDDCENVTCLNNGICTDFIGYYECKCPLGFTGTHCETSVGRVCYSCLDISDVDTCANQTICASGEECFLEHELISPGVFNYNLGCVPSVMCAYQQSVQGKRGSNAIQLCYECCDINGCNHRVCSNTRG